MAYWLLKTEPEEYSFSDLQQAGKDIWDGVTNNWALKHMRQVAPDDLAIIYHSGKQRCMAGIARITSQPYPDPAHADEKLVVFDLEPEKALSGKVTLSMLKNDLFFNDFMLVKFTRLSVMPVEKKYWQRIINLDKQFGQSD